MVVTLKMPRRDEGCRTFCPALALSGPPNCSEVDVDPPCGNRLRVASTAVANLENDAAAAEEIGGIVPSEVVAGWQYGEERCVFANFGRSSGISGDPGFDAI